MTRAPSRSIAGGVASNLDIFVLKWPGVWRTTWTGGQFVTPSSIVSIGREDLWGGTPWAWQLSFASFLTDERTIRKASLKACRESSAFSDEYFKLSRSLAVSWA